MPSMTAAGRRGRRHQAVDPMRDALLPFVGRVDQHRVDDRRTAIVRHPFVADRIEDRCGLDSAQANVRPGVRGHRPREAPAVAVEHRQRPQVHRMPRHAPVDDVRQRIQVRAAMVIDDALRIAGRAGRVVERDRIPFVGGRLPCEIGIALCDERLVIRFAQQVSAGSERIDDVDDERLRSRARERRARSSGRTRCR